MTWKVISGSPTGPLPRVSNTDAQGKESVPHQRLVRVLVVDDEPSICKALSMALSKNGYEAIAAQSGESALAIIRNEHIDVMLIDLRIPDMRGDVIFEVAAGHQPHLRYQTLFMTGDITEKARALIGACRCHYLSKPFDLFDMQTAVAAVTPRIQDAAG